VAGLPRLPGPPITTGAHLAALARDEVTFYTAPIKALVSEKFWTVLEGLERRLAERVDAHVGPGVAKGHVQVGQQLRDGLAGHRGSPVGVHYLRLAVDPDHVIDELGG
jgi:hypothetical protein